MDLRAQLQSTLGSAYTLERELGGGGMSRVFVANEIAYGRKVVIKVLPLELTQGVSVDRFKREIQLAAQLQHPHIVPLHTSGETQGLPYYTMPYVEGTSLRARLAHGPLPIGETISILKEVARALAYAHDHGVVHRDIKPDNVLLTGGSAVVTDFGIAKALSAAKTSAPGGTLTQMGTSIGTPMYMAPEQAAADPSTDHRADVYSFGCMAYEMLTGAPPFTGKTPHKLLTSHMGETPAPVTDLRPDTPPLLAELVMTCLEKEPDKRPQSARDLVRVLESVTTSGGAHPAMPAILLGGRPRVIRALAWYAAAFFAAWILARAAVVGIGLPTWVVPGTLIVMALGLPVILFTAFVHHGAHAAMTTANMTPGGTPAIRSTMTMIAVKASPWVSWRRTTLGGAWALAAFVVLIIGYMVMRAMGIGPVGSLMATGAMGASERMIIADFKSPRSDSTLGPVVTEAFRSDLAQSKNLVIVQPNAVRQSLQRMQKPTNARFDYALAREVAARDGIKAVIDGEVLSIGSGYVITATLYGAQTGDVLATFRSTAKNGDDIIPAISELSKDVRAKIGESLRSVNATPSLEQVTTPSLDALKKYVQGVRIFDQTGDFGKGIALLTEAVAIDTGFAMAYRKIAVELNNRALEPGRAMHAATKAYEHRDRLTEAERQLAIAAYYTYGPVFDVQKVIAAYEALLETDPNNSIALNNLAVNYARLGQYDKEEVVASKAVGVDSTKITYYTNLFRAQVQLSKWDAALKTAAALSRNVSGSAEGVLFAARMDQMRGRFDSAEAKAKAVLITRANQRTALMLANVVLTNVSRTRGQLQTGQRFQNTAGAMAAEQGASGAELAAALDAARGAIWFRSDSAGAARTIDAAMTSYPFAKREPLDRPYLAAASVYAMLGRMDRAKAMIAGFDTAHKGLSRFNDAEDRATAMGDLLMAQGRYKDAVSEYHRGERPGCLICRYPQLARAFDLAGNSDSATAYFMRYIDAPNEALRLGLDPWYLAGVHKRLGPAPPQQKGEKDKRKKKGKRAASARSAAAAWRPCTSRATSSTTATSPSRCSNPELGAVLGVERFLSRDPASRRISSIRTSCRCSTRAKPTGCCSTSCRTSKAKRCASGSSARSSCPSTKPCASRRRSPARSTTRTATASSTATSSRRTSCCTTGSRSSPTSASRSPSRTPAASRVTQTGLSLGTPQYMSPEQATGDRAIDGRTDIYSLGAVIYEMLAGEPPHTGRTAQAIIARLTPGFPRGFCLPRQGVSSPPPRGGPPARGKLPPGGRRPPPRGFAGPRTTRARRLSPARAQARRLSTAKALRSHGGRCRGSSPRSPPSSRSGSPPRARRRPPSRSCAFQSPNRRKTAPGSVSWRSPPTDKALRTSPLVPTTSPASMCGGSTRCALGPSRARKTPARCSSRPMEHGSASPRAESSRRFGRPEALQPPLPRSQALRMARAGRLIRLSFSPPPGECFSCHPAAGRRLWFEARTRPRSQRSDFRWPFPMESTSSSRDGRATFRRRCSGSFH